MAEGKNFTIQDFMNYYPRRMKQLDKIANIETIVLPIFHVYLTTDSTTVKEDAAWMIYRLKDEIKKGIDRRLWALLNAKEFESLVLSKIKKRQEFARNAQRRRHERRGDFALAYEEWEQAIQFFDGECAYCGANEKLTYDHHHPFSKGGSFTADNIIPACGSCNSSKGDNDFEEWYKSKPFYCESRKQRIAKYFELVSLGREVKGDEQKGKKTTLGRNGHA